MIDNLPGVVQPIDAMLEMGAGVHWTFHTADLAFQDLRTTAA